MQLNELTWDIGLVPQIYALELQYCPMQHAHAIYVILSGLVCRLKGYMQKQGVETGVCSVCANGRPPVFQLGVLSGGSQSVSLLTGILCSSQA